MTVRLNRNKPAQCALITTEASLGLAAVSSYASLLATIADPTRLAILNLLASNSGPVCVCDIADRFNRSQPTISHHLNILREAGLVSGEREGIWAYYSLNHEKLADLQAIMADIYNVSASVPVRNRSHNQVQRSSN